jgi:PatG C-terminal
MEEMQPMQEPPAGPGFDAAPSATVVPPPPEPPPGRAPEPAAVTTTVPEPPGEPEDEVSAGPEEPAFVYAIGQVAARFPSIAVEKEFAQVASQNDSDGLTDRQVLQSVLAEDANRYLVRELCWVFLVEGLETYVLTPRDPADFARLVETVRAEPDRGDVDIVIGERGPITPPEACNGLTLPLVAFDQVYSFDRASLIASIPRPEDTRKGSKAEDERFQAAAQELFDRVMQVADNAGAMDEHRALNYLAVREPAVYATTADAFKRNASLTGVEVRPSRLSGPRRIVDVVFAFTSRETDVTEKYFARVDVTEKFPFLVSRMAPFYDR